jgi:hypothetical protein
MIFFCFDDLKLSRTSFPLRVFFFAVAIDTKTCFTALIPLPSNFNTSKAILAAASQH